MLSCGMSSAVKCRAFVDRVYVCVGGGGGGGGWGLNYGMAAFPPYVNMYT